MRSREMTVPIRGRWDRNREEWADGRIRIGGRM
uniref:Uncharacterized protein n=1 Tax=Arundo donax TaxID=35708 RepID=A0A0A8YDF3_ARUDO